MTSSWRWFRSWLGLLAALALAFGLDAGTAEADHLDAGLNIQAPQIVRVLREQGVKTIGVLRFRVQEGDGPETFSAGPLNGNLAVRLENTLVIHAGTDEQEALGIIHNAGQEAVRRKVGKWYKNEAEQRKLFTIDTYPLAWGNRKVKADAFLSGLVKVSSDYQHGTVTVEEIREPGKVEKLAEFSFEGDSALLLDLGKSYSLRRRDRGGASTTARTMSLVFEAVNKAPAGNNSPKTDSDQPVLTRGALEVGGVEFQVLAGGQAVPIAPKGTAENGGDFQLRSPDPGKEIVFKIANKTEKTLGVDIKLNSASLFLEQTDEPANCRLWILKPEDKYRSYVLKGYYYQEADGEKVKIAPFKVLVGDEAQKWRDDMGQFADRVGTISITVFEEGDQAEDRMLISGRGLKKHQEKPARINLATLQRSLMKPGISRGIRSGAS